jgi:thiol-disulfide isomerase/thioredoxin
MFSSSKRLSFSLALWTFFLLFILASPPLPLSAGTPQTGFDLRGNFVDPLKAANGKISVLIFVRTDCPISNRYAPLLQHLNESYAAKLKFWLVYPDKKTTAREISEHLKQFRYTIPALRDPQHSLVKLAGATITPEAAVFDSQGKLLYHGRIDNLYEDAASSRPAATTHELQATLDAALAGKPAPLATAPAVGCYISDLE